MKIKNTKYDENKKQFLSIFFPLTSTDISFFWFKLSSWIITNTGDCNDIFIKFPAFTVCCENEIPPWRYDWNKNKNENIDLNINKNEKKI